MNTSVGRFFELIFPETYDKEKTKKLNVVEGTRNIASLCFENHVGLKEIILPNSLKEIGYGSFSGCKNLRSIVIPESVEEMDSRVFQNCINLKEIKLSPLLKRISYQCFMGCENLQSIDIPEGIETIGAGAFKDCARLKEVKLPKSIKKIEENVFSGCGSLERIEIPEGCKIIPANCFENCVNLKEIIFPEKMLRLVQKSFSGCISLEKIDIPEGVEEIGDDVFLGCTSLKEIKLSKSITSLGYRVFKDCKKLERIELPEEITKIYSECFANCTNLKEIKFPVSLDSILSDAFCNCKSLERIDIPESVVVIDDRAFMGCANLKEIKLPKSIKVLGNCAFRGCEKLESVEIPDGIEQLGEDLFSECKNLKSITLKNIGYIMNDSFKEVLNNFEYFYIDRKTGELICSKNKIKGLVGYETVDFGEIKKLESKYPYSRNEALMVELLIKKENFEKLGINVRNILPKVLMNVNNLYDFEQECAAIFDNNDMFNNMLKQVRKFTKGDYGNCGDSYASIFNLAATLGAFSDNKTERQAACEFISTAFQQKHFDLSSVNQMFKYLKPKNYNDSIRKEWSSFFRNKNNFRELIGIAKESDSYYITTIYNSFEMIKEFGRKSRGSQEYREVTLDMCKEYFEKLHFGNVSERDYDIAEELIKYSDLKNQESFDDAVNIRNEYVLKKEKGEVQDHILGEELKENSVFEQIEEERINALKGMKDTLEILDEIANKKFTYEFLNKYDYKNFVLGKYCSCCAHLQGAGYGIMKASILHPNCQNLIIRDDKGSIVAKSTLYVNREQGYGVFNNVEVNDNIKDEATRVLIYNKYMKAIDDFARRYNEINKDKPITQINVGMKLNDLNEQLMENNQKANEILTGMHFSEYGRAGRAYNGDWSQEQYVVWSKDSKKEVTPNGR